jgi:hypothetical protein
MRARLSLRTVIRPAAFGIAAGGALLGLLLAVSAPSAALAVRGAAEAVPTPAGTQLALTLPPPVRTGQAASLTGSLTSWGRPLVAAPVRVFIDGRHAMTLQAGADGSLRYRFPRGLSAGAHTVQLTYHGNRPLGLAPAAAGGVVTILPIDLTLQTMPAIPGVTFTVDGRTYVTGASGRIDTRIPAIGGHQVSVAPPPDTDSTRYRFGHWFDGPGTPSLALRVYDDRAITAAFSSSFRVPVSFLDDNGSPLDPSRVSGVVAVGPAGSTVRVTASQGSTWLTVPAPSSSSQAASARPVRFALASARFDGVSVANRGDDRFTPAAGRPWAVKLRVYTLRVQVRKPILGAPVSEAVVRGSSGVRRAAKVDGSGIAVVRQLPRDLYLVSPDGAEVGPSAAVEVSGDKEVDVTLYTLAEMGTALLGLALCGLAALGLPLLVQGRLEPVRRWVSGSMLRTPAMSSSSSSSAEARPPARAGQTRQRLVGAASAAVGLLELATGTVGQILSRRS